MEEVLVSRNTTPTLKKLLGINYYLGILLKLLISSQNSFFFFQERAFHGGTNFIGQNIYGEVVQMRRLMIISCQGRKEVS